MLNLEWPELLMIGAVAVIAVGPKDMPKVMYALGRWTRKARFFVLEMQRSFDHMAAEAERESKAKAASLSTSSTEPAKGKASGRSE